MPKKRPLSIRAIEVNQDQQPHGDLVMLHGLGGDSESTWACAETGSYLPQMLAEDLPGVKVWVVDYPAPATQWAGARRKAKPIPVRAATIVELLASQNVGLRPLAFIGHSLGGLIIKQIIINSSTNRETEKKRIAAATQCVLFLATPHAGAGLSNLASVLAKGRLWGVPIGWLLRLSPATRALKKNCPHLIEQKNTYLNVAEELGIKNYSYYENEPTGPAIVVTPDSADSGGETAGIEPVDANHFTIAKPDSRRTPPYSSIRRRLKNAFSNPNAPPPPRSAARVPSWFSDMHNTFSALYDVDPAQNYTFDDIRTRLNALEKLSVRWSSTPTDRNFIHRRFGENYIQLLDHILAVREVIFPDRKVLTGKEIVDKHLPELVTTLSEMKEYKSDEESTD